MRKLILLVLMVPAISFAAYIDQRDVGTCGVPHYGNAKSCLESEGFACIEKIEGYNCEYHILSNGQIVEDATKKTAYLARLQSQRDAETTERNQRIARLNQLRNTLDSLDGPLDAATIRAFIKHLVVEEIRRLKRELE